MYKIKKANAHTTTRFNTSNRKIEKANARTRMRSGLFGARKTKPKSNLPRRVCKIQRFSARSHRPDFNRARRRDIKISRIAKNAPDCRRAYYGAIPRAHAFSECAQNPSVSNVTPRSLDAGAVGAPRAEFGPLWPASGPRHCVPRVYGDLRTGPPKCARRHGESMILMFS